MNNEKIKLGFYKVDEDGGSYVVDTFFNPVTKEEYTVVVRDYDYFDKSRDNDELYYTKIDDNAKRAWYHHKGKLLEGDKITIVKGRKVPIGTVASITKIKPYYDCYRRWVADYAYLDNGMKTNINNCQLVE